MNDTDAQPNGEDKEAPTTLREALEQAYDDLHAQASEETPDAEAPPAEEAEPAAPVEDAAPEGTEEVDQPEAGEPAIEPETPTSWSDEAKAEFLKLSPEIQQIVLGRESEREKAFTRKTQELADSRRAREALDRTVDTYMSYFQQIGATPEQMIGTLMGAEQRLRTGTPEQKRSMLLALANDYGVNLEVQPEPGVSADDVADPELAALRQTISGLQTQLQSLAQTQQNTSRESVQAQVDAFQAEKDAEGNPRYPHFEQVRPIMGTLMAGGQAQDLKDAYDKAVWMDPAIRADLVKRETSQATKVAEVERAKRAAKANLPKTPAATPANGADPTKGETMRETMGRVFDELHGAG